MPRSSGSRRLFWGVLSAVVLLDVITKALAVRYLSRIPLPVLGDWIQLQLVYNTGAAFGLQFGSASRTVFSALAVLALVVLGWLLRETWPGHRARLVGLGLVAGGAIGNLFDRLRSPRGVVDFLDLGIGGYRWPTFNVADLAVTGGALVLAVVLWRDDRPVADRIAPPAGCRP